MEELKITVAKPTADMLHKVAEDAGIPIGEVVDRVVLDVAPDDPTNACVAAMEQYLICVSRLSKKDTARVFGDMCGVLLGSLPPEELDDIVSVIKSRQPEQNTMEPLSEEESHALNKAMRDMLRVIRQENLKNMFYYLFHG